MECRTKFGRLCWAIASTTASSTYSMYFYQKEFNEKEKIRSSSRKKESKRYKGNEISTKLDMIQIFRCLE